MSNNYLKREKKKKTVRIGNFYNGKRLSISTNSWISKTEVDIFWISL